MSSPTRSPSRLVEGTKESDAIKPVEQKKSNGTHGTATKKPAPVITTAPAVPNGIVTPTKRITDMLPPVSPTVKRAKLSPALTASPTPDSPLTSPSSSTQAKLAELRRRRLAAKQKKEEIAKQHEQVKKDLEAYSEQMLMDLEKEVEQDEEEVEEAEIAYKDDFEILEKYRPGGN